MASAYRVDVSMLSEADRQETYAKISSASFMTPMPVMSNGVLIAYHVMIEVPTACTSALDFKSKLGLHDDCVVTDIAHYGLLP